MIFDTDMQECSTGGEPYKLRGILNKEPRSLMTRFGPSPERGPGTQPHIGRTPNKIVSEFSVRIHHTTFYQCYDNVFNRVSSSSSYMLQPSLSRTMCSIERWTDLWSGQWPNVSYSVQSKGRQFLVTGQWP